MADSLCLCWADVQACVCLMYACHMLAFSHFSCSCFYWQLLFRNFLFSLRDIAYSIAITILSFIKILLSCTCYNFSAWTAYTFFIFVMQEAEAWNLEGRIHVPKAHLSLFFYPRIFIVFLLLPFLFLWIHLTASNHSVIKSFAWKHSIPWRFHLTLRF